MVYPLREKNSPYIMTFFDNMVIWRGQDSMGGGGFLVIMILLDLINSLDPNFLGRKILDFFHIFFLKMGRVRDNSGGASHHNT